MPTLKVTSVAASTEAKAENKWSMASVLHKVILGEHKANVNSEEIHVLMDAREEPGDGAARC